jgi:hypothetical protein
MSTFPESTVGAIAQHFTPPPVETPAPHHPRLETVEQALEHIAQYLTDPRCVAQIRERLNQGFASVYELKIRPSPKGGYTVRFSSVRKHIVRSFTEIH